MLIDRSCSQLLFVDCQDKLVKAMSDAPTLVRNVCMLRDASAEVSVPLTITEQYPNGLGHTVAEIDTIPPEQICEKVEFSAMANVAISRRISGLERRQIIICGIEAHICVLQTALELKASGAEIFVVADAVSSRRDESKSIALERMAFAGVQIVTAEMVVFEWLRSASDTAFRALSRLVK